MKIAQAIPSMNIGGAERVVLNYAKLLPERGHKVMVISSGGIFAEDLNYPGAFHVEAAYLFQRDASSIIKSIGFLRTVLLDWQPEIIQAHSLIVLLQLWFAVQRNHSRRPKIVYSIHGLEKQWAWPLVRYMSPTVADKIVTVSPYHYSLLINWGLSKNQVVYIPNGLPKSQSKEQMDQKEIVRKELGLPIDKILVGTVCRLIELKGVHFLLQSLAKVGDQVHGLIIGDGPELERLTRMAENLGISDRVVFTGYRKDARRLMNSLDLFCSLSENEAFPVVLLEAMQRKIPVLCFNWNGAVEIMGNAAFFVPHGDVPCLAKTINQLAQNNSLRVELGNSGYCRFMEKYTMDKVLTDLEYIYNELLES